MARLSPPAIGWDRFCRIPPLAARVILAFTALLLSAAALTAGREARPDNVEPAAALPAQAASASSPATPRDTDLQLYDRIAERVAAGEDYYAAAVEEQRARNFPVRPGLAVRLPTLALLTATLGQSGMIITAILLGLAVLAAWWRRLGLEPGGAEHRTIAMLLLVVGSVMGLKAQYLVLHEVWAGMLLALAFALYRPRIGPSGWIGAWIAAAAALAIREQALPFVLLLGAMALWRRDWREFAAWALLTALFIAGLTLHLAELGSYINDTDRLSPSWLALRGLAGWTGNIAASSSLYLLPDWLAAPLALLPLLGWASWRSNMGLFGLLLFAGYGIFFMIAGRENNFYWALIVTPAWFVGWAFVPHALASLWRNARVKR